MISRILGAIRAALANSVRAFCAWGDDVLSMPWHVLQAMRDAVYGAPPPSPVIEDVEASGPKPAGPVAQRRDMVERGLLPMDLEPARGGPDPLGEVVWKYACNPRTRHTISIDRLSPDQQTWLLSLEPNDLDKLAEAGSRACSKLVRGQKTSSVSLAPCGKRRDREHDVVPSTPSTDPSVISFAERLERIAVARRPKPSPSCVPAFG